jgi:DnaJ-related protein SCJ1
MKNLRTLIVLLLCAALVAGADLYGVLGVSRNASEQEIKKAYRRLSLQFHPDRNKEEGAQEKFIEISHAYDILSDADKRQRYDRFGDEGDGSGQQGSPFGGGNNPFASMFSNMFGGGGQPRQRQPQAPQKTPNKQLALPVTLEELFLGSERDVTIPRTTVCAHCHGTGAKSASHVHTCPVCNGSGVEVRQQVMGPGIISHVQTTCSRCGGRGSIVDEACPVCRGARMQRGERVLNVVVRPGMAHGDTVRFEGMADEHPDGLPGDVYIVLQQEPHPVFDRDGDDLKARLSVSVADALLGFETDFEHLDGSLVHVSHAGPVQPGEVIPVRGEGMPRRAKPKTRGDLYVTVDVEMPQKLSRQARKAAQELAEALKA